MKMSRNEITIRRGETFTIDKFLSNADGSPFIVSSGLTNPRLMLTVASSEYCQNNLFVNNYFLPIELTFLIDSPINLHDIKNSANGNTPAFRDFDGPPEGYYNGQSVQFEPYDAVFYLDNAGTKTYKYWDGENWKDYNFRFIKAFTHDDTKNWIPQTYYWALQLVSGTWDGDKIVDFDTVRTLIDVSKLSVLSNLKGDFQ